MSWIRSGEIAIPEIQRAFVWNSTKVCDLIDYMHAGFPVATSSFGKTNACPKDDTISSNKNIFIDGQATHHRFAGCHCWRVGSR